MRLLPFLLVLCGCPTAPADPLDLDADGDGFFARDDCDDGAAHVFPGAEERCNGIDDDCDGAIDEDAADASSWYADEDGDGWGDSEHVVQACEAPFGTVAQGGDCNDRRIDVSPGVEERCDGIDNDCDDAIDELGAIGEVTVHADADGDGFGDAASPLTVCFPPAGYVSDATDCDDGTAGAHPGAEEVCDGIDNDCDGVVDEPDAVDAPTWHRDADGDGFGAPGLTSRSCTQPDGYVADGSDCADDRGDVWPGAVEVCNGVDDDCDGEVDEPDAVDAATWFADGDGDGYGDPAVSRRSCEQPAGHVDGAEDCDDERAEVNPAAEERCDGIDNDCDGTIDEPDAVDAPTWYADGDGDGFGDPDAPSVACAAPAGHVSDDQDCDDDKADVNPDADEIWYDGVDQDCDGASDYDQDGDGHDAAEHGGDDCDDLDASRWKVCDDGSSRESSGRTCRSIHEKHPGLSDGTFWIDPDGDGKTVNAFQAFCDMATDGGGWTLLAWTGNSAVAPLGVPYPGHSVCPSLGCLRGSTAPRAQSEQLIRASKEFAKAASGVTMGSFRAIRDYEDSGKYSYPSLSQITVVHGNTSCGPDTQGVFRAIRQHPSFPNWNGRPVYVNPTMTYQGQNFGSDGGSYIWVPASVGTNCGSGGQAPGVYLGTFSDGQYGAFREYLKGAHSVWVR